MCCCLVMQCTVLYAQKHSHTELEAIEKYGGDMYIQYCICNHYYLIAECICSTIGAQQSGRCGKSSTSIQLNWTAPSPANGIIVYYTVLVNSTSNSTAISTGSNATTYVVTGLVPCALYTFAVSATTGCAGCTGAYSGALTNVSTAANSVLSILLYTDVAAQTAFDCFLCNCVEPN